MAFVNIRITKKILVYYKNRIKFIFAKKFEIKNDYKQNFYDD